MQLPEELQDQEAERRWRGGDMERSGLWQGQAKLELVVRSGRVSAFGSFSIFCLLVESATHEITTKTFV